MKIFNKNEWKKVKLGDVCDILDSKRIPISEEKRIKGEYPYYGANGIQGYINDYIFDEELVLLAEDGGNFGSKTKPIAYKISGKTWINNHAHVLKAKDEIISTDFLLYSLMFYDVTKLITGTTRKKLTRAGMEKITIHIPTLSIQNKITDYLNKIENFISFREHQLSFLKELNKSLFTTMFGDPFSKVINKEEEKSFLKDITIINPSKKEIEEIKSNLEISFITMVDISEDGRINVDNIKTLEDVKNNFTFFKENDVLFAKITPCMENGKGGVAKNLKNNIGFGTTEIHVLRPISNITNSQWIYHLTKLPLFRKDAEIHMTGSAGQKRVPTTYLANFKIKVPPIELQNKFAERVEKIEKLKFTIMTTILNTYEIMKKKGVEKD